MSGYKTALEIYKIYNNDDLTKSLYDLELRYAVNGQIDKYNKLVNFSQNSNEVYHQWFKYREGFSGKLIEDLINRSSASPNEIIVDPFCGSGTTLVSAVTMGFDALGIDVNPMSTELSKVKTKKYDQQIIKTIENELIGLETNFISISNTEFHDISKYFDTDKYFDLMRIKKYLDSIIDSDAQEIMNTAFLSIIEEVSNRKRDGNGLKFSKSKIGNVLTTYSLKLKGILKDINTLQPLVIGSSHTFCDTSKNLKRIVDSVIQQTGKKVGAIIYSPPYANSFDYFESYKLELEIGGFLKKDNLKDLRSRAIYSFVNGKKMRSLKHPNSIVEMLATEIEVSIPEKENRTGKKDSRTRKVPDMIRGYFDDMADIIQQSAEVLESGKECYIVVDQSSYLGKIVPTDLILAQYAEMYGFICKEIVVCRPSKTSGQQIKLYPYLRSSLRESIVVLEKK